MAKAPNYTEEVTNELVAGYIAVAGESEDVRNAFVAEAAAKYGKSVRSIRAKLSRENVYIAKTPVAKDGNPAVKKEVLAAMLETSAGVPLVSAEKMNKEDIKKLIAVIDELREQADDHVDRD